MAEELLLLAKIKVGRMDPAILTTTHLKPREIALTSYGVVSQQTLSTAGVSKIRKY